MHSNHVRLQNFLYKKRMVWYLNELGQCIQTFGKALHFNHTSFSMRIYVAHEEAMTGL